MCTEIQVKDGPRLDHWGALRKLVGRENIVVSHEATFDNNDCLCHVNVQATAAKAGFACRPGWDEASVDFIWERAVQGRQGADGPPLAAGPQAPSRGP